MEALKPFENKSTFTNVLSRLTTNDFKNKKFNIKAYIMHKNNENFHLRELLDLKEEKNERK